MKEKALHFLKTYGFAGGVFLLLALRLAFSASAMRYKAFPMLLYLAGFVFIALLLGRVTQNAAETVRQETKAVGAVGVLACVLFFDLSYFDMEEAKFAGLLLLSALTVYLAVFYRQSWLLLGICALIAGVDSAYAMVFLPCLALLIHSSVRKYAKPAGGKGKQKKRKQKQEELELANWGNCYAPALVMLAAALGLAVYRVIQIKGPAFLEDDFLQGFVYAAGSVLPFSAVPAHLCVRALRPKPEKALAAELLGCLLLPCAALLLLALGGPEDRDMVFFSLLAVSAMQYAAVLALLYRKNECFTQAVVREKEFLQAAIALSLVWTALYIWQIKGFVEALGKR